MTELSRLMLWFIFTTAAGWSVLTIVLYRKPILFLPEKLALSYCLGLGLVTIEMALISVFNMRFGIGPIVIWWTPIFLIAAVLSAMARGMGLSHRRPDHEGARYLRLEKFFIFGMIFEICCAFFRALVKPLEAYDAIAIYALKAKAFYMAGCIPRNFFQVLSDPVCHPEYPLALPLAESSIYVFLGNLNDLLAKVISPLYYVAALVIFYFMARRFIVRRAALLFTFLLATIPQFSEHAAIGYADLMLAFYYSASLFYLVLWIKERKDGFLTLSFLMSILSIWTKTEGLMLTLVNIIVALVYIPRDRKAAFRKGVFYILATIGTILSFLYIKKTLSLAIHSNVSNIDWRGWLSSWLNIRRIPEILYYYQIQFFGPKKWNIIWPIFIFAFILNIRIVFAKMLRPVTLAILLLFAGYTFTYLINPQDIEWLLSKTAGRFFLQILPIILLWLVLFFKEKKLDI